MRASCQRLRARRCRSTTCTCPWPPPAPPEERAEEAELRPLQRPQLARHLQQALVERLRLLLLTLLAVAARAGAEEGAEAGERPGEAAACAPTQPRGLAARAGPSARAPTALLEVVLCTEPMDELVPRATRKREPPAGAEAEASSTAEARLSSSLSRESIACTSLAWRSAARFSAASAPPAAWASSASAWAWASASVLRRWSSRAVDLRARRAEGGEARGEPQALLEPVGAAQPEGAQALLEDLEEDDRDGVVADGLEDEGHVGGEADVGGLEDVAGQA